MQIPSNPKLSQYETGDGRVDDDTVSVFSSISRIQSQSDLNNLRKNGDGKKQKKPVPVKMHVRSGCCRSVWLGLPIIVLSFVLVAFLVPSALWLLGGINRSKENKDVIFREAESLNQEMLSEFLVFESFSWTRNRSIDEEDLLAISRGFRLSTCHFVGKGSLDHISEGFWRRSDGFWKLRENDWQNVDNEEIISKSELPIGGWNEDGIQIRDDGTIGFLHKIENGYLIVECENKPFHLLWGEGYLIEIGTETVWKDSNPNSVPYSFESDSMQIRNSIEKDQSLSQVPSNTAIQKGFLWYRRFEVDARSFIVAYKGKKWDLYGPFGYAALGAGGFTAIMAVLFILIGISCVTRPIFSSFRKEFGMLISNPKDSLDRSYGYQFFSEHVKLYVLLSHLRELITVYRSFLPIHVLNKLDSAPEENDQPQANRKVKTPSMKRSKLNSIAPMQTTPIVPLKRRNSVFSSFRSNSSSVTSSGGGFSNALSSHAQVFDLYLNNVICSVGCIRIHNVDDFLDFSEPHEFVNLHEELTEKIYNVVKSTTVKIDSFHVDEIVFIWFEKSTRNHEMRACTTMRRLCEIINELNKDWKRKSYPALDFTVGISCGNALEGNIGCAESKHPISIGDPIDIAKSLTEVARTYKVQCCVSLEVKIKVKDEFLTRPITSKHEVHLTRKSKTTKIMAIELGPQLQLYDKEWMYKYALEEEKQKWSLYTESFNLMTNGKIMDAEEKIDEFLQLYKNDYPGMKLKELLEKFDGKSSSSSIVFPPPFTENDSGASLSSLELPSPHSFDKTDFEKKIPKKPDHTV